MIQSKQDIIDDIDLCQKFSWRFNASWIAGCCTAMRQILDEWDNIYEGQRLTYAVDDAQRHLWDFFSEELCLYDDECDLRVDQAIEDGTILQIAHRFLDNYDCNVAENDQYNSIIHDIYHDKFDDEDEAE